MTLKRLTRLSAATAVLTALQLTCGVAGGLAAEKQIEAVGSNNANFAWSPASGTRVPTGSGTVEFKNLTPYLRAIEFEPQYESFFGTVIEVFPSCSGVPSTPEPTWSGTCTFPREAEWHFFDPSHPAASGVVTVVTKRAPDATTEPATAITEHGATINGLVNPRFLSTTFHFVWGPTIAYGEETKVESAGSGAAPVPVSAELIGLSPGGTYHYRLEAENSEGETIGADHTFTVRGPPVAFTELATDVAGVEAALNAIVNPSGLSTTYYFNYGTTNSYGLKTAEQSAGAGFANVGISELVTGLSPNTTYHFQIVAENAEGEVKGADRSFKTFGPPKATTGGAETVTSTTANLTGIANAQGQETTYYFNWGLTSAYGARTPETVMFGKGLGNVDVGAAIADLTPATTYHFQLVVHSASGVSMGADQVFVTNVEVPRPPPPPTRHRTAPETLITGRPRPRTHDRTPTVRFSAIGGGASFQCSVDRGRFRACHSPFTAPRLKPGRHRIRVRASADGLSDKSPSKVTFKVLGKKKRKKRR